MSARRKSAKSPTRLGALRTRIDQLDETIQTLISERAQCAQEIATTKQQAGDDNFYKPEREVDVLRRVIARNQGPLSSEEMAPWPFSLGNRMPSRKHAAIGGLI